MGLTFVAFEGYEIIAQSGEELVNPRRNLPRAIFLSIGITVIVYLLVAFVSVGALVQESGLPNWVYLAEEGEKAMIRTAQAIMPWGLGAIVMILGGVNVSPLPFPFAISPPKVCAVVNLQADLGIVARRISDTKKPPF